MMPSPAPVEVRVDPPPGANEPPRIELSDLVVRSVSLRILRRELWLVHLERAAGEEDTGVLEACRHASIVERDEPGAELEWRSRDERMRSLDESLGRIARDLREAPGARLRSLGRLFRLGRGEMDLLQLCLALDLDPGLGRRLGRLQGLPGHGIACESTVARLFGHGRSALFGSGAPLLVWRLVSEEPAQGAVPPSFRIDPLVSRWLRGRAGVDERLVGAVGRIRPRAPLPGWPVERAALSVRDALGRGLGGRQIVEGVPGSGRRTLACLIAARAGIETFSIDSDVAAEEDWPEIYMRAQRLAHLSGAAPVWTGRRALRPWPAHLAPYPVQFVICTEDDHLPPHPGMRDQHVTVEALSTGERRKLWTDTVPGAADWPEAEVVRLAARYPFTVGEIAEVALQRPATPEAAAQFCRGITRARLNGMAEIMDCPFTWDDLVVPDLLKESLRDFVFEAGERAAMWEQPAARRLLQRGAGLVGLLSGPPGCGKTMTAQILAAELGLNLLRIDIASVLSKWIGETAKALARVFRTRANAVILFDEADALFAKRTDVRDAHDRHANTDTNYLLQLLEGPDHGNIILLCTNKRANMDPAFVRRIRHVFEFGAPDAAARASIWKLLVGELCGDTAGARLGESLEELSVWAEMSGAQIKNALLAALFIARRKGEPLSREHLARGVARELAKEGRSFSRQRRKGVSLA